MADQQTRDRSRETVRADRVAPGRNDVLSDGDGNAYKRNRDGSWGLPTVEQYDPEGP